jgi:transcriptional regulator with XRE-family HTH domain
MSFGDRLQQLRKAAGLSQAELATRSETSLDTLRRWEQGRNLPNIEAAAKLARALGVSLDDLAGPPAEGTSKPRRPRKK